MKKDDLTTISDMPKPVSMWGMCRLLHKKRPIWNGNNITYVCEECAKLKTESDNEVV